MALLALLLIEGGLYALFIACLEATETWTLLALGAGIALLIAVVRWVSWVEEWLFALFGHHRVAALLILGLFALTFPFFLRTSPYWIFVVTLGLIYGMIALGLNLQLGTAGVINLAGAAFSGIGAYTVGLLTVRVGLPVFAAFLLGPVVAMLIGALLFVPILKTRGHYLALVTIAFVFIFNILVNNLAFTGGPQGIKNIPTVELFGHLFTRSPVLFGVALPFYANFFYSALLLISLAGWAVWRLHNSWVGLTLNTVRDDETVAKCFGVSIARWKLLAFSLGNVLIGLGGAFYAVMVGFIAPANFTFGDSLIMVSIVILGGLDSIPGVLVAAMLLILLPERFRFLHEYRLFLYGVAIVTMLLVRPHGLWPSGIRRYGLHPGTSAGSPP
ncbi:MAG: branched-chain amino acid ABC transporter permease [Candidatus Methylomirabilales bacterium]